MYGTRDQSSEVLVSKLSSFYLCCSSARFLVRIDLRTLCPRLVPQLRRTKLVGSFEAGSSVSSSALQVYYRTFYSGLVHRGARRLGG